MNNVNSLYKGATTIANGLGLRDLPVEATVTVKLGKLKLTTRQKAKLASYGWQLKRGNVLVFESVKDDVIEVEEKTGG